MSLLSFFTRKIKCAAIERDLDRRLTIRKQQRLKRSCAALKGWETRRRA